jgi:N-acetylglucosamine kinase-like BadF-type ATPase
MELYLGIDGGQSSTVTLIGDENGQVIGFSRGGPCNHVSSQHAEAKLRRVFGESIDAACKAAGLNLKTVRFTSACCGLSGGPTDKRELLSQIISTDRLVVKTDGEIALTGALNGRPGIVVIAGTGSIAFGCNETGRLVRTGGWGYVFGDEGGAFDIVRQALRACLRYEEGWGARTSLLPALLEATGVPTVNDMLHLFYTDEWPRSRVATLSEVVELVSAEGDLIARGILEHAGQNLAALASSVRAQLFSDTAMTEVSFIGGVFRSNVVLERFRMLVELADGCRCVPPALNPAAGALLEAYAVCGKDIEISNVPALK